MKLLTLSLFVFVTLAAHLPVYAGDSVEMPPRSGAMDRNVSIDLTNDGDYEVRHVYLQLYSVWSRRSMSNDEIRLDGPMKQGQTKTLTFKLDDVDPKSGMFYVLTWYWDDKGNCSESMRFPDQGNRFTGTTGKAVCKSGKTPPEQMRADKLADSFENGERDFAAKRWEQAVKSFTDVLAIDPKHFDALHHRAHAYQGLNQPDKAIADFTGTIALQPRMAKLYNDRAMTHIMKKDYDSAVADFNRAMAISPDSPDYLYRRSQAYCLQGKKELAAADEKVLLDKGLILPKTCE